VVFYGIMGLFSDYCSLDRIDEDGEEQQEKAQAVEIWKIKVG
jgi:hypothetical protein